MRAILAPNDTAPTSAEAPPLAPDPVTTPVAHPAHLRLLAFVGLALVPVVSAVAILGRIHPDEVYQSLEPAWHKAFGYGVLAWEWRDGIRNWATPDLFANILQLGAALGVENPQHFRALIGLPLLLLHTFALRAVFLFARRRVSEPSAWIATVLVAFSAAVLLYAGRTLSETISVGFILIATELLDRREGRQAALAGGLALGLAVVARYGSAVIVLAALVWLAANRRFRFLFWTCVGGGIALLGLTVLDWATWGKPLHSFLKYVDFNVLSGRAAQQFGQEPWNWYLPHLVQWTPAYALLGLPFLLRKERLPLPVFLALAYFVALTLTPHKEARFLYPTWVLLTLAAAVGVAGALERLKHPGARAATALLALGLGFVPFFFTPELRGDQFRAIVKATRDPDATGLLIVNEGLWGAGGFFYVGKNIPWGTADWPRDSNFRGAMRNPRINRAVTFEGRALEELQAAGFTVVDTIGRETILRR